MEINNNDVNNDLMKATFKEVIKHTLLKVFSSRKGFTWFSNYCMDMFLTFYLVIHAIFSSPEKVWIIFYLIVGTKLMQLLVMGLIQFEKIKTNINLGK